MTDERDTLRETLRGFFARESSAERVRAAEALTAPGFDPTLWSQARALGVPHMAVDGADLADLAVVAGEYGRALAPIPLVETLVATRLLDRVPVAARPALDGDPLLTVALRPAADDVATLVPAGAVADGVVVLHDGALVLAHAGRHAPAPPTLGSGPVADWTLDDATMLLDGDDARTVMAEAIDDWRALMAAALVGLARRALELGVDYAKARHQFGVPIGSFQSIQHRLAEAATLVEAAALLAQQAVTEPRSFPERAAMAYLAAVDAARAAAGLALHVHGGYGFMVEYDVQLYFRRASAWPLLLGDPADELTRLGDLLEAQDWTIAEPAATGFRAEVRAFLAEASPEGLVTRVHASGTVHDWDFHRAVAARGLLRTGWDPAWGGEQRSDADVRALWEELARAGAPIDGWGTSDLVARTLARVGTEAQRREVVPRVLDGDILICLGYSEPDSGSDVAAASTRAERDGDGWVINGQKMFTTLAHEAEYVFLLTRTNREVPKHRGLTMFLVPMGQPGIEITPIHTLSGERTNITYYTDVHVPDACRVGAVDGGWDVMTVALAYERNPTMVGELDRLLRLFLGWARANPAVLERAAVRDRLTRAVTDLHAGRLLSARMSDLATTGALPIVEGSMAKLFSSEALVRASAGLLDSVGAAGMLSSGAVGAPADGWVEVMHRHAQVTTIRAGTSEIQRTIIAERGLGLPRSGR
ncbi:MAG TPA: acyl-CoA dehydrogenase [Acidimicrobiia bacterium]|nr:acyl-CoA dehydrogenase [Acidimicrobiia bacterium]